MCSMVDRTGWKVVSKQTPVNSSQGAPILPASSNVSDTVLLDDIGGGGHDDTKLYEVKFITAGTYQLFSRQSMNDSDGNGNFGNEDSVYLSSCRAILLEIGRPPGSATLRVFS
jgi:hypothetical protein